MKKIFLTAAGLLMAIITYAQTPDNPVCIYCGVELKTGESHKPDCIYSDSEVLDNIFSASLPAADGDDANTFVVDFSNKAQILLFKDASVKRCALEQWDENNDGKLTVGEAEKATRLWLMFPSRKDMFVINTYDDMRFFPNLEYLNAGKAWKVEIIDLSNNPKLKEVDLSFCLYSDSKKVKYAEGLTMVPKPSDDPWKRANSIYDNDNVYIREDLIDKSKNPENVEILDFNPKDGTDWPIHINDFSALRHFPRLRILRTGDSYVDTLDLSNNPLLEEVDASRCQALTTIILAKGQKPHIVMPEHRYKGRKPKIIHIKTSK